MDQTLGRARAFFDWAKPWLSCKPYSGKFFIDVVYLVLIGAIHHTVLPDLVGGAVFLDLMTPWLVTIFVAAPPWYAALFGLLGSLILETHSAAPSGMYFCAYWVICVVLRLTRSTLSWRHAFPWMVT